ncbi:hypothetical protein [Lelliottia wanjuensis]|uniref:hypothetical protein n=1 Tax=Lelliottia wanjuensis TaxID=3050585 RepID=UPI00254FA396|nr:hypothetical protein [Lelliottia sp. V104_15]MDK9606078.1 hypothetical protein [Lelliottia sp. V104_15]
MSDEIKHMFKSMGEEIVRLAPYVTLLSGLVVWDYLHSIGRVDIFPQVLSFNAGLISIHISTTIFALGISMMLIIPSSILIFVRSAYEENSCAERVLIKRIEVCESVFGLNLTKQQNIPDSPVSSPYSGGETGGDKCSTSARSNLTAIR